MAGASKVLDIHLIGVAAAQPAASSANNGYYWTSTDVNGGTTYRSNGSAWVQVAKGVSEGTEPSGSAGGDLSGTYPNPGVAKIGGVAVTVDTDGTLAANSDAKLATQKAIKTYADRAVIGPASASDAHVAQFDGTTGKLIKDGLGVVTTVGSPGSDSNVATEKAIRTALAAAGGSIEVKEVDGSPDVTGVTIIRVSNGTLTNDGGGQVTITTGGGGVGSPALNVYLATTFV